MDKVSIVIPCYNSALFIQETIDSLLNQSFRNCEFLFINDGSTDETLSILEINRAKDSRIIIINSDNEGVSSARNKGLVAITGDYVMFCDSDDVLEKNAVETLLQNIKKDDYDIAVAQYNQIGSYQNNQKSNCPPIVADKSELMRLLAECKKVDNYLWGKLYKRKVFDGFTFNPSFKCWEDIREIIRVIQRCNSGIIISDQLVNYRVHSSSLSKKLDPLKIYDFCEAQNEKAIFLLENYPKIAYFHSESMFQCGSLFLQYKLDTKSSIFKSFCSVYRAIVKKAGFRDKIKYFIIKHNIIYNILFRKRR